MRIGGVSIPDFNSVSHYTKSPRKMNEEKFREAIVAQAKKDHAAGKFQNDSAKYQKEDIELTFAEFYDSEGNMIASYDRGKWNEFRTPDETARQIEFCSIYNQAWGDAKRAAANPSTDDGGAAAFDQLA